MEVIEIDINNVDDSIMDNHFREKLNEDLQKITDKYNNSDEKNITKQWNQYLYMYRGNDSPLTMSNNNSDDDDYIKTSLSSDMQFQAIGDYVLSNSNAIDVLKTYLYCQKQLFQQCSHITLYNHNALFLVTVTIPSSICIIIAFIDVYIWSTYVVIISNAMITLLLVIMKYSKLEIKSELYKYISYQFDIIVDTLNSQLENTNSAIPKKIKVRELEKRIIEMKKIHSINTLNVITGLYPVSHNINIFAFIKKVETGKVCIKEDLNKINNEIKYILKHYPEDVITTREKNRLEFLLDNKKKIKVQESHIENAYSYMDEIIIREHNIAHRMYNKNSIPWCSYNSHQTFTVNNEHCNPFVDEYITFIIPKK